MTRKARPLSRRALLLGAAGLGAGAVTHGASAAPALPSARRPWPLDLPAPGERDPARLAGAEVRFGRAQLAEHAELLALLLPQGPHREGFRALERRWTGLSPGSLAEARALAREQSAQAARAGADQAAGRLHTLAWPLLFTHAARTAAALAGRLEELARGAVDPDPGAATVSWALAAGTHAQLVAHLLDPGEAALTRRARAIAHELRAERLAGAVAPLDAARVSAVVADLAAFQRRLRGLLHPRVLDHLDRHAAKALDALRRLPSPGRSPAA